MTKYVTYITIGNQPNALRDYLCKEYGLTEEQVQSVLDIEPYGGFKSSEDRYQWVKRVMTRIKALR